MGSEYSRYGGADSGSSADSSGLDGVAISVSPRGSASLLGALEDFEQLLSSITSTMINDNQPYILFLIANSFLAANRMCKSGIISKCLPFNYVFTYETCQLIVTLTKTWFVPVKIFLAVIAIFIDSIIINKNRSCVIGEISI